MVFRVARSPRGLHGIDQVGPEGITDGHNFGIRARLYCRNMQLAHRSTSDQPEAYLFPHTSCSPFAIHVESEGGFETDGLLNCS